MKERNLDTGSPAKPQVGPLEEATPGLTTFLESTQAESKQKDIDIENSKLAKTVAAAQKRITGPIGAFARGALFGTAGAFEPVERTRVYGLPDRYAVRTDVVNQPTEYSNIQLAGMALSPVDTVVTDLLKLAVPYRQEVAPRISAAFLVASPTWRENNQDVTGTYTGDVFGPIGLFGSTATPAYEKALADSRKAVDPDTPSTDPFAARVFSPGRSLITGLSDIVPGEQAIEKLNWEDNKEIDNYFRQGLPQFFSGLADFGFNWLDPVYLGPAAGVKGYNKFVRRPVTNKNVKTIVNELEISKDPNVRTSFSPMLDVIEEVSRPETFNPGALYQFGAINGGSGANLVKVLVEAQIVGGRSLVSDVWQAAIDKTYTKLDEIKTKSTTIGAQLEHLLEKESLIKNYVNDLLDVNTITPPISSVKAVRKYLPEYLVTTGGEPLANRAFAQYLEDEVLTKIRAEIAQKSDLAKIYMDTRGIAGTALNETVPVAALRKLQENRVIAAQNADDTLWGFEPTIGTGGATRAAYWVNPSAYLKEAPRGMAQLAGPAGLRSDREIIARIRDIARTVGMSPQEARALRNEYVMLGTKSEMFGFADELLTMAQLRISGKHIPKVAALTVDQQRVFKKIFETLNLQTHKRRGQVIQEASAKNYTLTVDGKGTQIPQLKNLIDNMANDYVVEIASTTGKNIPIEEARKYVLDELIKGTPTTTSQVPGIHFAPRASQIEDFVIMHKEELTRVVNDIIDGTLTPRIVEAVLENPDQYINKGIVAGMKAVGAADRVEIGKLTYHALGSLARGWQDHVWKPMTLLGFVYTTRNVLEGMSRIAILLAEFNEQRGYKYTDMFADLTNVNISRTVKAITGRGANKGYRKEVRDWKNSLEEFDNKFNTLTAKMTTQQKNAEDAFLNSQDSVALSMKAFNDTLFTLNELVTDSAQGIRFLQTIRKSANLAFKQGIPKGASKNFIDALVSGNYQRSWELSASMSAEQLQISLTYIKNQSLETLREVGFFLDKGDLPQSAFQIGRQLQIALSHINAATDTAQIGLLERAKARGELEDLIAKFSTNKPVKVRADEGLFEPIKGSGYLVDDSYANNIGQIMRGQVSSAASTTSTILNVRQQIAQTKWNMYPKEELIFPYEFINDAPTTKVNQNWAQSFADYANNIYHNDALSVKILKANTPAKQEKLKVELEKWLKSKDSLAWRNDLEYEVSKYPSRGDGKSKYVSVIEERMTEVNNMFPLRGANGEDLSALRAKVVNRTFTREDALKIPEIDRMPVNGVNIARHPKDIFTIPRWYRSKINSLFKYLGTIPEDTLVRFPFYRMVYRNEVRRRYDGIISAGKNPDDYVDEVLNAARQEAYKQVMERLYSIERYTDLGQAMQFLSPFYMSGQNSARFWAGAVSRNPAVVVPALKVWNIPNAMGVVYDEEGNRVAYDTPWSAESNEIQIGLPISVANYFGAKNFSVPKQSLDLSFQSRVPGVPSLGGAYVDWATVNVMPKITGTILDPDLFALKVGLGPNFIGEKVIPFYNSVKDNPNENFAMRSARAIVGFGSQWKSLLAIGSALDGKANNTFMTREDSLYRSALIEAEMQNKNLTPEEHAKALAKARSQTIKSFIAEWFLGMGFPPSPVKMKFENIQQIERDKANYFFKKYGYEQGMIEYAKTLGEKGDSSYIPILATANVATDNIFGLYANTQSVRNFKLNKDLVEKIDNNNSNSSVVGYLLNEGNPSQDYSITADEFLYTQTINNKNIKTKVSKVDAWELQRRAFNNDYYPYANLVDLMRKSDAEAGREESAEFYETLKDNKRAELEEKYTIYAKEKNYKLQDAVVNDIRTIYAFLDDEKYMRTVGSKSKVVTAAKKYLLDARPILVDLSKSGVSKSQIDAIKLQYLEDAANGDAEVRKFMQIFFSRDDYTPIDPNNVWND